MCWGSIQGSDEFVTVCPLFGGYRLLAIAVGTTIADCPPHGPGRALISASGSYRGWITAKRTARPHTRPPVGHAQTRSVSGTCQMEERSPRSAAFPPHSPPTMLRLCSNDSSVLCRCVTPRRRTCEPCGLSLLSPSCHTNRGSRHPRGLPVLVHEVSRRVWGLRLRRTEQELALTFRFMLPSAHYKDVGVRVASFRSSIAHPAYSPVYASPCTSRYPTQNSGPSGSLLLTRKNFPFSASCRFSPAHCNRDFSPTDVVT